MALFYVKEVIREFNLGSCYINLALFLLNLTVSMLSIRAFCFCALYVVFLSYNKA